MISKRTHFVAVAIASLLLSACGDPIEIIDQATAPQGRGGEPKSNEGTRALEEGFRQQFSECDGTWVAAEDNKMLYQYQNIEFWVYEHKLTAADKANDIEFAGHISFGPDAMMRSRSISSRRDRSWSEWRLLEEDGSYLRYDGMPLYTIKSQNQRWDYTEAMPLNRPSSERDGPSSWPIGSKTFTWSKPSCEMIDNSEVDALGLMVESCIASGEAESDCSCIANSLETSLDASLLSTVAESMAADDQQAQAMMDALPEDDQAKVMGAMMTAGMTCMK